MRMALVRLRNLSLCLLLSTILCAAQWSAFPDMELSEALDHPEYFRHLMSKYGSDTNNGFQLPTMFNAQPPLLSVPSVPQPPRLPPSPPPTAVAAAPLVPAQAAPQEQITLTPEQLQQEILRTTQTVESENVARNVEDFVDSNALKEFLTDNDLQEIASQVVRAKMEINEVPQHLQQQLRNKVLTTLQNKMNFSNTDGNGDSQNNSSMIPPSSFMELSSSMSASGTPGRCEVCVYVIENKEQHQHYLCRGLKDPAYQQICEQVMESMMWWLVNEVYWVNYGCQRTFAQEVQWVRPCPAHVICGWLENLYDRMGYCPPDPEFKKPA
eukprot:GILJ01000582.1.p1 GENE.GILJ01000582.1~~GILJ01000582.1.p1  ORF type:complete len:348 (+),score=44.36 GILJ01000582.1:71-1045(+)